MIPGLAALIPVITKALGAAAPAVGKAGLSALASAGIAQAIPQRGMTQPLNVPQLGVADPMIALQQLMAQTGRKGGM